MISVFNHDSDGATHRHAKPDTRDELAMILLDGHPTTAPITLLAPSEIFVYIGHRDTQTCRDAFDYA